MVRRFSSSLRAAAKNHRLTRAYFPDSRQLWQGMMVTTEYVDGRFGRYRLRMAADCCPRPFLELCCGRAGVQAGIAWEPVPSSPCAEVARFEYDGGQYYHKRYLERGWPETIKAWLFGSRAERAWRGGHLLEENAFGVPQMLVAGWQGARCFMVTRAVAGGLKLEQYVREIENAV